MTLNKIVSDKVIAMHERNRRTLEALDALESATETDGMPSEMKKALGIMHHAVSSVINALSKYGMALFEQPDVIKAQEALLLADDAGRAVEAITDAISVADMADEQALSEMAGGILRLSLILKMHADRIDEASRRLYRFKKQAWLIDAAFITEKNLREKQMHEKQAQGVEHVTESSMATPAN